MPAVSIIVPVYKVEKYLDRCVKSLVNQTYTDIEIILVDDGSPDSCPKLCDSWAKKDSRIKVIHKQNGGLSDARNVGIDMATGDFFTFVDSDDYVKPTYVGYLLSLFSHSKSATFTACDHFVVRDGKITKSTDFDGVRVLPRKTAFEKVLYHDGVDVSACMKMYRKSVFETLRYPVGRLFEDTYLFGDILNITDELVFGGSAQYYYFQHSASIVNSAFNEKTVQYIKSAKRLVGFAKQYPDLKDACVRCMTHARLRVLRYMENCDKKYLKLRNNLRTQILSSAKAVLCDPKAPKRDKAAILLLGLGFKPFFASWRLYGRIR